MLSKKTRYAIVALIYIARESNKEAVMSTEIARSEKLPQRFLENILLELKKIGILGSKPGKSGGYFLTRNAEDISLAEVVRHFEGAVALLACVSEKSYKPCEFCKDEMNCKIRNVFKEIRDTTFGILDRTKLSELL